MKKSLLFGLSALFALSPIVFAQNAPSIIAPSTETVTDTVLQPVAGKSGVWTLGAGNYNFRKLLTLLTAKTGGQAYFDTLLGPSSFVVVPQPLQGTVPELIGQLIKKVGQPDDKMQPSARTGEKPSPRLDSFEVVQVGTDWLFLRVKPKSPVTLTVTSPPPDPIGFRFNINRSPRPVNPKNLPPDAVPLEFNGERVYYVPLPAKGK